MANLISLLILTLLYQAMPLAHIQPQKPAEQQRPLRLKTDLIEIRVVVSDKRGKIVDDLRREDFEIIENGREQQVAFYSLEKPGSVPTKLTTPPKIGTDLNWTPWASQPKRTIVLFVDTLHLSDENYLRIKQTLRKFIEEEIGNNDLVAVISSAGPMGIFNQFTRNRHVLLYAVEKLRPWGVSRSKFTPYLAYLVSNDVISNGDAGPTSVAMEIVSAEEGVPAAMDASKSTEFRRNVQLRARAILSEAARLRGGSLRTLEAAMDQLAMLSGQRIVFYISEGFSLQGNAGNAHGDLNKATSRAVRSGILVYSIDARGLETDLTINDPSSKVVITPTVHKYLSDSNKDLQDAVNALGKDTGGDAFFNNNDMGFSMKKALDANSIYYALAYYPPAENSDRGYRRLIVRVKNHPEYSVRAPKGYLPQETETLNELGKQTSQQALMTAIAAPLPQTTIGVTAVAHYIERDIDNAQVSIEVFIDGTTLDYGKHEGREAIDCEVTTVIFDQTGKSTQMITDKVQGSLTAEQLDEGRKNGYRYLKRLALKPGIYQARVGVRENGSERVGTASAWVEVPNLSRVKLAVSSIVLRMIGNAAAGKESGRNAGPELLVPGVRQGIAYFKHGTSLAYQLTVYEGSSRKPEEMGLLIQSEVAQAGHSIYRSEWQPVAERLMRVGKKGFDLGGQINLDLNPGIYELRVTVKDPKSNRSAQQTFLFEVEG